MKITLPADKNSTLVFEDGEEYNIAVGVKPHSWYTITLIDYKGNVQELCRVDKADVKRLAKAS